MERQEGIGTNAVLYSGNIGAMDAFAEECQEHRISSVPEEHSPSRIIAEEPINIAALP